MDLSACSAIMFDYRTVGYIVACHTFHTRNAMTQHWGCFRTNSYPFPWLNGFQAWAVQEKTRVRESWRHQNEKMQKKICGSMFGDHGKVREVLSDTSHLRGRKVEKYGKVTHSNEPSGDSTPEKGRIFQNTPGDPQEFRPVAATVSSLQGLFVGDPEVGNLGRRNRWLDRKSGKQVGYRVDNIDKWLVVLNIFFMFLPTWGNDPIWWAYFSDGLKPPTREAERFLGGDLDLNLNHQRSRVVFGFGVKTQERRPRNSGW